MKNTLIIHCIGKNDKIGIIYNGNFFKKHLNSIKHFENLSSIILSLLNKNNGNQIIIRHHIPIKELRFLSNDRIWTKDLPSSKKVNNYIKNSTFISGDGGAFNYLQRIGCLKLNSNKYIINGIGEKKDDRIIILNNKKILQYKIYNKN